MSPISTSHLLSCYSSRLYCYKVRLKTFASNLHTGKSFYTFRHTLYCSVSVIEMATNDEDEEDEDEDEDEEDEDEEDDESD